MNTNPRIEVTERVGGGDLSNRIPALDGLRAVAVLIVMFGHTSRYVVGNVGVELFFVLSGYLITLVLSNDARQFRPLGQFYWRRWLRLFPALALLCIALIVCTKFAHDARQGRRDAIAAILYVANWCRAYYADAPSYLGNTWSVAAEEQFYLLWPAIFLTVLRRFGSKGVARAALTLLAIGFVWRTALALAGSDPERIYNSLETHCDGLLLGCAMAAGWPARSREADLVWLGWLWPLACGVIALCAFTIGWTSLTSLPISLAAAVIVITAHKAPSSALSRALRWPPLVYTGAISYSLYLWHYPIGIALMRQGVSDTYRMVPVFLLSFLFAGLSYRYLESYALSWRYRGRQTLTTWIGTGAATLSAFGVVFGIGYFLHDDIRQALFPRPLAVEDYAPKSLHVGESYNVQPNGESALWIRLSAPPGSGTRLYFEGRPLDTATSGSGVNAIIPRDLNATPGEKTLTLDGADGRPLVGPIVIQITP